MDKLRDLIKPDEFTLLKVTKTTIEFVRFEGEVETRAKLQSVVLKLNNKMIKLKDFSDLMRIRAVEWKSNFPNRRIWDDFFQNSRDMNEMKPGERPDTMHLSNLPSKWFIPYHLSEEKDIKPSEKNILSCYVQFKDYIGFTKAMDAFRDMKLVHKEDDDVTEVNIKIDFDKSKHLSDASIRRREIVRERLVKKAKEKEEKDKAELEEKQRREKIERRKLREEKRKAKILETLEVTGTDEINEKIAKEEKKLLRVQRKLEAIRLVEELFRRIKREMGAKKPKGSKIRATNDNIFLLVQGDMETKILKLKLSEDGFHSKPKTFKLSLSNAMGVFNCKKSGIWDNSSFEFDIHFTI
ncbi:hypothetical protein NQ314_014134 [Rhamnusium bicolor]|uniref:Uncharacterized protein n=1 Tax=Rhamnusium bicolor TaxID=1586634 RepID=A0AAV8X4B3_9CUCU|nr:hypothetical protein NQ314_014134 [Rhamnusium bicolor]